MKQLALLILICFGIFLSAAETDSAGFIGTWLIAGPYPSYVVNGKDTGLETDCLKGETKIRPYPGLRDKAVFKADLSRLIAEVGAVNEWGYKSDMTFDVKWNVHQFPDPRKIMVDGMFKPIDDHFVFYAACFLNSPTAQKIKLRIGSDDYHKVFLNGREVGSRKTSQGVRADDFIYPAELKAGINFLLLKVVDVIQDCGFCVAVSDMENRPAAGLEILTEHPGWKLGADIYDKGFGAKISHAEVMYDDSADPLEVRFIAPDDRFYEIRFGGKKMQLKNGMKWKMRPEKVKNGRNKIQFQVRRDGELLASMDYEATFYSRKWLRKDTRKMTEKLESARERQRSLERKISQARNLLAKREQELESARKTVEMQYAGMRERAVKKALPSLDQTQVQFDVSRAGLLLNGFWKAGTKQEQLDSEFYLPGTFCANFFLGWFFPVVFAEPSKPHSSKVVPQEGYEGFKLSPLVTANRAFFAKEIRIEDPGKSHFLVFNNVVGKLSVYCNGKLCGQYDGCVGIVEIPLGNVKKGMNRILLKYEKTPYLSYVKQRGILEDIRLETMSPVRVADVWIKSSWRKAELKTVTELENRTAKECSYRLVQYVTDGGRIRFRLPEKSGTLQPGKKITVDARGLWRDPRLWNLEDPFLYDLVSDLYVDGKPTDRKYDRFGFREFWIHGTDFMFNGKRMILQGDVGHAEWSVEKYCDVAWPLYRKDGINTLRLHDSYSFFAPQVAENGDRYGMFIYAQMYPEMDVVRQTPQTFTPLEKWRTLPVHQWNLENYRRWFRMLRNHPSVIVWSTDNEIFTQSKDSADRRKLNIRNDSLAAEYARFMEVLDPELIVTRDGDIGTWNSKQTWFETPPRMTANYHYPDFNLDLWVKNWESRFEFRPVIFGETLYCSYGAWNKWCGAVPDAVRKKAQMIRKVAPLYRKLGVPGQIYMGLGLDGFIELKEDGSGIPYKVVEVPRGRKRESNWRQGVPATDYPWMKIDWPAYSGRGRRAVARGVSCASYGDKGINWCSERYVSHVRNAVNDAYRDSLIPQPPLPASGMGECIIQAGPGKEVWTTLKNGSRCGIVADRNGRAWFLLDSPGRYEFESDGVCASFDVPSRSGYAAQPGFHKIKVFKMEQR